MRWHQLLLIFALLLVVGVFIHQYIFNWGPVSSSTIVFTEDGFLPVDITVPLGTTVTFINKSNEDFWPASDLHPSHEVYSAFDPKQPLPPGAEWRFTFRKAGVWGFHDHLRSNFEGSVTVSDGSVFTPLALDSMDECLALAGGAQRQCWNEFLISEYHKGGLSQGYAAFTYLYINDETFSEQCHDYTHTLGDLAYETYSNGGEMEVSKEVAYCTYGFFHGFMESLIHDTGTYDGAREFCDEVNRKLEGVTRSVGPCLHGIGHGVTDASDPRFYGDPHAYAKESLELCDVVGRTEYEIKICATGVFNAVAGMYLTDEYGLSVNEADVYEICRDYDRVSFREACYEDFKIIPIAIEDRDFQRALVHPVTTPDDLHYQQISVDLVAMMHVYSIQDHDFAYSAGACNELEPEYRTHCIQGLASGFSLVGIPDEEYKRALAFCGSEFVVAADKSACYDRVQWESLHRFSPETYEVICSMIPEAEKTYCYERDAFVL